MECSRRDSYGFASYKGNLQDRLSRLSLRTNCPTRQENGQRYLGPPLDWTSSPPLNAEVFISKLPSDCFEDEIYDFCSQAGTVYLIRLMINFENENRGFCFVTFASAAEATAAVNLLPLRPLRKGVYVHAEISLNNCTLKMYGLDFRRSDANLEQEIRTNSKDVVNVTIKRNVANRTVMATLYFDTHQKAAIARRKLSQIANSRWGQNVKVFLWSKKLQNKKPKKWGENSEAKDEFLYPTKESPTLKKNIENFEHRETCSGTENYFQSNCKNFGQEVKMSPSEFQLWTSETDFTFDLHQNIEVSKNGSFYPITPSRYGSNNTCSKPELAAESNHNFSFEAFCSNSSEMTDSSSSSFASPITNSSLRYSPARNYTIHKPSEFSLAGSPSACSKSSWSDLESPPKEWNLNPKNYDVLDLYSPFDFSLDYPSSADLQNKQIEIILREAVEALGDCCFKEK